MLYYYKIMPFLGKTLGGMNPFNNNKPNLSSSDRTRDKRSKYIYAAAKQKFQTKRSCNSKNIKYYRKGTVRSTINYKIHNDLARGNVLCEDCNDKGMLCGDVYPSNLATVGMRNNSLSEYWGGGNIDDNQNQTITFPVVQADISGVWRGSAIDISKSLIGPNAVLPGSNPIANMPYGYINNLIRIPRNLDGSGIVIDPSNTLFPSSNCGIFRYMKHVKLKTVMVLTGAIPFPIPGFFTLFAPFESCNYNYDELINKFVLFGYFDGLFITLINGIIEKVCCIREQPMGGFEPGTQFNPKAAIYELHISLFFINEQAYPMLSQLNKFKPRYDPNTNAYDWSALSGPAPLNTFLFLVFKPNEAPPIPIIPEAATAWMTNFESIKFYQGTCDNNQTTGNQTAQSYMSCLEDGTKKVNFT